jgi:DNA anti-recombination protein RmuC
MRGKSCAVAAAIGGLILAMLAGGCQQEQAPQDKQARLVAAQNLRLQRQLEQCRTFAEALAAEHAEQLKEKEQELEQCRARNSALQADLREGVAQRVKNVTDAVVTENAALREKVKELLAEIERLKAGD